MVFSWKQNSKFQKSEVNSMKKHARTLPRMVSLAMAIAMALTMVVSAFATDIKPSNVSNTKITADISYSDQN